MVEETKESFCVGDMVRMARAQACFGMIVELSDAWRKGKIHHVRVHWLGGEMKDPPAATWIPIKELEIISKMPEESIDKL